MKRTITILSLLSAAALFFSCDKNGKEDPPVIDMEHHYNMVYMLGAAAKDSDGNQHWDSADPLPMKATDDPDVFEYDLELIRSTENKLIKFCLTTVSWETADFLVPVSVNDPALGYTYLKEGVNELCLTSQAKDGEGNLKDWFFGIPAGGSGVYHLEVNPVAMTLTATKIESRPDPETTEWVEGNLYMVGDGTPNGWDIGNPTPMVRDGNIHTYEGPLSVGEMKIVTKFAWASDTWRPATGGTEISKSGIADEGAVLDPDGADPDDPKWKVVDAGNYRLTLDTEAKTMKVEWLGE